MNMDKYKKRIDEHFKNISKEELLVNLNKCGLNIIEEIDKIKDYIDSKSSEEIYQELIDCGLNTIKDENEFDHCSGISCGECHECEEE